MLGSKSIMIELSEKRVIEVREGQYGPYLAVGRKLVQDNTKYHWVFLSKKVTRAIDAEKIDELLKKEEKGRLQLSGNHYVEVAPFRGSYYIGFLHLDAQGEVIPGKRFNLNREEWQTLKEHLPALLHQLEELAQTPQKVRWKKSI